MNKKENIKDSLVETGKNLGSGLIGMVTGSALGRHSLWTGALTIFGGAWYHHDWLTSIGVGMVASNGFSSPNEPSTSGIDGFQDELTNAKDRAVASLKALGKKVYLDKISPEMGEKLGLGELEDADLIFLDGQLNEPVEFDTSEVDEIIQQLEEGDTDQLIQEDFEDEQDEFMEGAEDALDLENGDEFEMNDLDFSNEELLPEEMEGTTDGMGNMDILDLQGVDQLELNATA